MVPREELERSLLYQRGRELDMPLEHVMAVLLDLGLDGHGGFMLYRDRRRPFSDRERALLQRLTPALTRTVRNCRQHEDLMNDRWVMEEMWSRQGTECVMVSAPSTEVRRTKGATKLLEDWFSPSERGRHGLPLVLVEHLERMSNDMQLAEPGQNVWKAERPDRNLCVTFTPLTVPGGRRLWALTLQEFMHAVPVPAKWNKKLTKREKEVVARVLRGWVNLTIAEDLGCAEDTVKRHLLHVYNKLGVPDRKMLMHLATQP
jgi:DNA-binding CsgD family transcriptional regulator